MSSAPKSLRTTPFPQSQPLPPAIRRALDEVRQLLGRFVLSEALIQWCIGFLASFWLFGFIDYLPATLGAAESPRWIRFAMLMAILAGTLYILHRHLWSRWLVRWTDDAIALLIERKYPKFESALITTVQASRPSSFSSETDNHPHRMGFLSLARSRAEQCIPEIVIPDLVKVRNLQWQLVVLGFLLAVSIIIASLHQQWAVHWSKRLFALSNAPWPRNVQLGIEGIEFEVPSFTGDSTRQRYSVSFVDGKTNVPKGQSGLLKSFASLDAKSVPELCTVYYRDDDGNRGRANMRRMAATGNKQGFLLDGPPLESISESLWLSISGGDARISDLRLEAVDSPMITSLQIHVSYPPYLQRSTQSQWGNEAIDYKTGLRLPQGSKIELHLQANKEISRCDYVFIQSSEIVDGSKRFQTVALDSPNQSWSIPVGELHSNLLVECRVWDSVGVCSNRVQQFVLSTIIDQPPQVDMVLEGIGTAITEVAILPIKGKVKDEYDVRQAWIEAVPGENSPLRIDTSVSPGGELKHEIDCKELRDSGRIALSVGSTLAITLAASDYFDLISEPHIGKANSVQLSVVTPDQLLLLLDRREAAMRKRLEQIIGEVAQLRDLLVNIQRREAGELEDAPVSEGNDAPTESAESKAERRTRILLLRSQQAMSQISKSEGELSGVEKEIGQIARELVNNRIDSVDRRQRWQEKIQSPLRALLDGTWKNFSENVTALEKNLSQPNSLSATRGPLVLNAIKQNDEILSQLQTILSSMLEIQDQTAIIDMLRDIIDSSGSLIDETKGYKKTQDRNALELLK